MTSPYTEEIDTGKTRNATITFSGQLLAKRQIITSPTQRIFQLCMPNATSGRFGLTIPMRYIVTPGTANFSSNNLNISIGPDMYAPNGMPGNPDLDPTKDWDMRFKWCAQLSLDGHTGTNPDVVSGETDTEMIDLWNFTSVPWPGGGDDGLVFNGTSFERTCDYEVIISTSQKVVANMAQIPTQESSCWCEYGYGKRPEGWCYHYLTGKNYTGSVPLKMKLAEVPDPTGTRNIKIKLNGTTVLDHDFLPWDVTGSELRRIWNEMWTNTFHSFDATIKDAPIIIVDSQNRKDYQGGVWEENKPLAATMSFSASGYNVPKMNAQSFNPSAEESDTNSSEVTIGESQAMVYTGVLPVWDRWIYGAQYKSTTVSLVQSCPSYKAYHKGMPEYMDALPCKLEDEWQPKTWSPCVVTPIIASHEMDEHGDKISWSYSQDTDGTWNTTKEIRYGGTWDLTSTVTKCPDDNYSGLLYSGGGLSPDWNTYTDGLDHSNTAFWLDDDDPPYIKRYKSHGLLRVSNVAGMGEGFSEEPHPPDCPDNSYYDNRIMLSFDEAWAKWDSLRINTVASKRMIGFYGDDVAQWTSHLCDLDTVIIGDQSYIRVTNAQPGAYIERTWDPSTSGEDVNLCGGRYAELEIESSATNGLEWEIAGRKYDVTPQDSIVDVLCCKNFGGSEDTHTLIDILAPSSPSSYPLDANVPWDWGIVRPGTIRVSGFEASQSYTLKGVTLHRAPEDEDGSIDVWIVPQGSWARVRDIEDGRTWIDSGNTDADTENWWQRCGIIVIDGIIAGEIVHAKYSKRVTDSGGWAWSVVHPDPEDDGVCFPFQGNGFFTITDIGDGVGFATGDRWLSHLRGGHYKAYDEIEIEARPLVDSVIRPVTWDIELELVKYYRGIAMIKVIESSGRKGPFMVHIDSGSGIQEVSTDLATNKQGYVFTPALTWQSDVVATVIDADPAMQGSTQIDTRSISPLTIKAAIPQTDGAIDCDYCRQTNRLYLLYCGNNGLIVRIFDSGSAEYHEKTISESPTTGNVGIAIADGRYADISIVYESGDDICRRTTSDEGNTWETAMIIGQGTSPHVAFNHSDGVEIVTYISEDNIKVRRKLGDVWEDERIVAPASENDRVVVGSVQGSRMGEWVLFHKPASGNIVRYTSTDSGRTWQI